MDIPRKNSRYSRSNSNSILPFQLVTPQEIVENTTTTGNSISEPTSIDNSRNKEMNITHLNNGFNTRILRAPNSKLFHPSLRNTRELEDEISILVQKLKKKDVNSFVQPGNNEIIEVLNKALMALSHWTLQGQLSQMIDIQNSDNRYLVETHLVKKEVEFLKNKITLNEQTKELKKEKEKGPNSLLSPGRIISLNDNKNIIDVSPKTRITQNTGQQKIIRSGKIKKPRQNKKKINNSTEVKQYTIHSPSTFLTSPTNKSTILTSPTNKSTSMNTHNGIYKLVESEKSEKSAFLKSRKSEDKSSKDYIRVFQLKK